MTRVELRALVEKYLDQPSLISNVICCRDAEIEEIEEGGKNYQTSVYYMDIVSELEKMGDFMINISQTLEKVFVKR